MDEPAELRITKWPFFIGDALLVGLAVFFCFYAGRPAGVWEMSLAAFCVAGGAVLGVTPFLLEYRATTRIAEASALSSVVSEIQNIEGIATQISGATGQWQTVQAEADKTAAAARQIAERMSAEVQGFAQFMEKVSDREKATLRLEVEKFRRAETEWLQVLMRMLDHVYALHVGALRSSQTALIEQVGSFQNACRDAARRIGLAPFTAAEAEPFDGQRHQLADDDAKPEPGATVLETIAVGYTFQGKLLRPALVRLANGDRSSAIS